MLSLDQHAQQLPGAQRFTEMDPLVLADMELVAMPGTGRPLEAYIVNKEHAQVSVPQP